MHCPRCKHGRHDKECTILKNNISSTCSRCFHICHRNTNASCCFSVTLNQSTSDFFFSQHSDGLKRILVSEKKWVKETPIYKYVTKPVEVKKSRTVYVKKMEDETRYRTEKKSKMVQERRTRKKLEYYWENETKYRTVQKPVQRYRTVTNYEQVAIQKSRTVTDTTIDHVWVDTGYDYNGNMQGQYQSVTRYVPRTEYYTDYESRPVDKTEYYTDYEDTKESYSERVEKTRYVDEPYDVAVEKTVEERIPYTVKVEKEVPKVEYYYVTENKTSKEVEKYEYTNMVDRKYRHEYKEGVSDIPGLKPSCQCTKCECRNCSKTLPCGCKYDWKAEERKRQLEEEQRKKRQKEAEERRKILQIEAEERRKKLEKERKIREMNKKLKETLGFLSPNHRDNNTEHSFESNTEWFIFFLLLNPICCIHLLCFLFVPLAPFVLLIDICCSFFGVGIAAFTFLAYRFNDMNEYRGINERKEWVYSSIQQVILPSCCAGMLACVFAPCIGPMICTTLLFGPIINYLKKKSVLGGGNGGYNRRRSAFDVLD